MVVVNVMGSVLGPVSAGLISDLLAGRFGQESIRYSLLSMSSLTVAAGLLFLRAAWRFQRDVADEGGAGDGRPGTPSAGVHAPRGILSGEEKRVRLKSMDEFDA
jgi:hypothetical protein